MTLPALRDDALAASDDGATVRLSLPWIRSLPLSSVLDLELAVDGEPVEDLLVDLGGRLVRPRDLAREPGWWFLQDRLVLRAPGAVPGDRHDVSVTFRLAIPYLPAGPDAPLTLPFAVHRALTTTRVAVPVAGEVSRDVA